MVVARERGGMEEMDFEFGLSRCKLLYIEWGKNKDMEKRQPSYTLEGKVNWYRHYREQYGVP